MRQKASSQTATDRRKDERTEDWALWCVEYGLRPILAMFYMPFGALLCL